MAIAVDRRGAGKPAGFVVEVVRRMMGNDLLTFASAIAFQLLTALVPFALFAVALLGVLSLETVYQDDVMPKLRDNLSSAAFTVVDDTVDKVFGTRNLWWISLGAVLAIYQFSGAIRAAMGGLNRVYGCEDDGRSWGNRIVTSVYLAVVIGALIIVCVALIRVVPLVLGDLSGPLRILSGVLRWALALGALVAAMALMVRHGPEHNRPAHRVTTGAVLAAICWLGGSALFGLYLTELADYGSVFGALASIVVLLAYLYLSALAFLAGVQADALLTERST